MIPMPIEWNSPSCYLFYIFLKFFFKVFPHFAVSLLGPGRPDWGVAHRQPLSQNFAYHFSLLLKTELPSGICWKILLHGSNTWGSYIFQNTKWLFTFTECHICYYCLLAVNQGNYARGLFLKKLKTWSFSQSA